MIDAKKALEIANAEAIRFEWGGVSSEKYDAELFDFEGRSSWSIYRNVPVSGYFLSFIIDAQTGEIIQKRRRGGPR